MNLNQLNIYFYVRPSSDQEKRGTFYTRVIVNGEQIVCSVKSLKLYPKEFDHKTQNPKKNCDLYFECQSFMVGIRQELNKIHMDFENTKHIFTKQDLVKTVEDVFHRIKNGRASDAKTYLTVFDEMIEKQTKMVGKTLSRGTHNVRKRYRKIIAKCLAHLGLSTTPIVNIRDKEAEKVQELLKMDYAIGTAGRIFPVFSSTFEYAKKNHLIAENPCKQVTAIKYSTTTNLVWLENEEVLRLIDLDLQGAARKYRDAFVFCCFTGLSIGDYELLNPKVQSALIKKAESPKDIQPGEIITLRSGKFLMGKRRKTGTPFRVPILPEAEAILKEYGGIENLPFGLAKVSNMLNTIMQLADIKKTVRFHTARKSMANYLLNVKMIDPFYVRDYMGWRKIEEAEPYTKLNPDVLASKLLQ